MASSQSPTRIKRILAHYHAGGFTRVLKHLLYYACVHNWILWWADIRILVRTGPVDTKPLKPLVGYAFGFAAESQLDAILSCVPDAERDSLDKLFRRFFHDGCRCVVAYSQKRVVGYLWAFAGEYVITLDDYRRCCLRTRFPSGAVFTGNAYVMPTHRGHDLYQHMGLYLMSHYPAGTCFYASVNDLNVPSLTVNQRLGFTEMTTARFVGVFSRTLLYMREAGDSRWRRFPAPWPDLQLDGKLSQALARDSSYKTPRVGPAALRWPRGPMRIRQERRRTSTMGRPIPAKSPRKSPQL